MWSFCGDYYELQADQMSDEWMRARQYRLTTSKWSQINNAEKLAESICGDPIIKVDNLPTELQEIIGNENNVRQAYIKQKGLEIKNIRTPGLIIPNPKSKLYNFVEEKDKHLLLHIGCSPDLIGIDPKTKRKISVELKQPINDKIYPVTIKYNKVKGCHKQQVNCSGGIVNSVYNDYFVWTKNNGHVCVRSYTSKKIFQEEVLKALNFVKEYIIPNKLSMNVSLPEDLVGYYNERISQ